MKVKIKLNNKDYTLLTTDSIEELNNNIDGIASELITEVRNQFYRSAQQEEVKRIKEFVNSDAFTDLDALKKFFDETWDDNDPKSNVVQTLYAQVVDTKCNRVLCRNKFIDYDLDELHDGMQFTDGRRVINFRNIKWKDLVGYDNVGRYYLFLTPSLEIFNKYKDTHFK